MGNQGSCFSISSNDCIFNTNYVDVIKGAKKDLSRMASSECVGCLAEAESTAMKEITSRGIVDTDEAQKIVAHHAVRCGGCDPNAKWYILAAVIVAVLLLISGVVVYRRRSNRNMGSPFRNSVRSAGIGDRSFRG